MEERGENPNLKLVIEKGPRRGETLDCTDGSTVQIGRVIKGNTFTIKDPAISQKHLIIQSDGPRWSVSDLDTSNGTFVNDARLRPNSPFHLSDGDVIKIGTTTAITVSIERKADPETAPPPPPPPPPQQQQQQPQRKTRGLKKEQVDLPESNLGMEKSDAVDGHHGDKVSRDESEIGEKVNSIAVETEEKVNLEAGPPRRRNPRRRAAPGFGNSTKSEENAGHKAEVTSISNKYEQKGGGSEIPPMPRTTRNTRRRAADAVAKVACKGKSVHLEADLVAESCRGPEKVDGPGGVDENPVQGDDAGVGDKRTALENITLGEWFDRMEKYLPKKVNEAADEIIESLRQRHKQFEQFIIERHRNGDGKLPVSD